ncbi:MAG TPA: hypothetical protein VN682_21320 [Terriglobales bacterium]|nr:hypothetical protein [Terriglobales bacterium]
MRWITDEAEFREIFLRARTCVYIDSGREPTALKRLDFLDVSICRHEFANLLQTLMERSGEAMTHYVVLDPDPVHYFHRHFKKYPALEIEQGDSSGAYLSLLNEDPGDSPADAVGTNWWACVVVPPSIHWFAHTLRSDKDDSGHLWIPSAWVDQVREVYPFLNLPFTEPGDRRDAF